MSTNFQEYAEKLEAELQTLREALKGHLPRTVTLPSEWNPRGHVSHGASIPVAHPIDDPCDLCILLANLEGSAEGITLDNAVLNADAHNDCALY